ncbi:MAG: GNAT family N-acetyltransferase [Candidatus Hodarchaeota archaeon]
MQIRKATPKQLHEIASFVSRLQTDNTHHICYFGTETSLIEQYLEEQFEPAWHQSFLLTYEKDKLIGLLGVEYDATLGRAWLHGPMVDHKDWQTIADKLLETAQQEIIPPEVTDLELAGDVANTNLRTLAKRKSFTTGGSSYSLRFERKKLAKLPVIKGTILVPQYYEAFELLHDKLFPGTYYSGRQLIERLDDRKTAFIVAAHGVLQGYIYAQIDIGSNEGYIDFLGVEGFARRRGIGTKLIIAAVCWLFSFEDVNEVSLTVNEQDKGAIELYTQIGFDLTRTLQGYRKKS